MGPEIQKDFEKSKEMIEDLKGLLSSDLYLFIDQALHHLSKIQMEYQKKNSNLEGLDKIYEVVIENVTSYMKKRLLQNDNIQSINYSYDQNITIKQWNTIFKLLPEIIVLAENYVFRNTMNISIKDEQISIFGVVDMGLWPKSIRQLSYEITRSLLSRKILLTYDIIEQDSSEILTLTFNLNHSEDKVLLFSSNEDDINICLPGQLAQFEKDLTEINQGQLYFVMNSDFTVGRYTHLPERFLEKSDEFTHLFFPFLFRPISFIIPRRGRLQSKMDLDCSFDSQNARIATDVGQVYKSKNSKKTYFYLDFFSLFNK